MNIRSFRIKQNVLQRNGRTVAAVCIVIVVVVMAFYLRGNNEWFQLFPSEKTSKERLSTIHHEENISPEFEKRKYISGIQHAYSNQHPRKQHGEVKENYKERYDLIDDYIINGRAHEAKALLEGILKEDPNQTQALNDLGMYFLTVSQDFDGADYYFKRVLTVDSNNEDAVMGLLALAGTDPDRFDGMLAYLKSLYNADPNALVLADGIGELLVMQGEMTEALYYFKMSAADPRFSKSSYATIGDIYRQMGQLDQAVESYQKAIDIISHEIDIVKTGNDSEHLIHYMNYSLVSYLLNVADIYIMQGKVQEAVQQIDNADKIIPNNPEVTSMQQELLRKTN